jgi:transposase
LPFCRIRHKGKKINGTKRHIAVDVLGLLLTVLVTAASVQDRDAAKPLLWNLRRAFPTVRLAWADGGYAGKLVTWAAGKLKPKLTLEIVKRPDDLHTFKVLPRRWVVERTLSWITRHRRTVRDYERLAAHHETYVYWAMIIVMTRRLARQPTTPGQQPPEFSSRLLPTTSRPGPTRASSRMSSMSSWPPSSRSPRCYSPPRTRTKALMVQFG